MTSTTMTARSRSEAAGRAADPDEPEATGRIVAVRQGPLLATSFHPEVGGDGRVHRLFLESLESA